MSAVEVDPLGWKRVKKEVFTSCFTVTYIYNFSEFTYTHREIQDSSELFNIFTFCEGGNVIDIILNQGNTNDLVKLPRFGPRPLAHLKGALNFENFTY